MDKKSVVQLHSVLLKGDAVSNIMRTLDTIHKEESWGSSIIADLFSEYEGTYVLASYDYDKTPMLARVLYFASRFIRLTNKTRWLKEYMNAKKHYRPGVAKNLIESADIRIWHYGAFYTLFRYFHAGDILFYHGITSPYLSYFSEFGIYSKNMLQAILDMNPFIIVHSKFIKQGLIDLGFKESSIHIIPAYHKYNLPYIGRQVGTPHLIAWGRYAKNKAVPELTKMASEANLNFTYFGDNYTLKEHKTEYEKAKEYLSNKISLQGQIDDFEGELSKANIYICNSYFEGFNMPLIEAEAHSLPVLARRGTAMDELIKDGYNGFLFSDISEVPELVSKIMKDYDNFSYNAWKHTQNFTYEKFKQNYLRMLSEYKKARR